MGVLCVLFVVLRNSILSAILTNLLYQNDYCLGQEITPGFAFPSNELWQYFKAFNIKGVSIH